MLAVVPKISGDEEAPEQQASTAPPPEDKEAKSPTQPSIMPTDEKADEFLVRFDAHEPLNPLNWSIRYRCWITFQLSMLALAASLGSSIISPANSTIAAYVGVGEEVAVLNVSLYVYALVEARTN